MTARILKEPCRDHGLKGNKQGYARTFIRGEGRKMLYHRFVFWQEYGYLPPVVMHECDNSRCIEPTHLKAGDWDQNNRDRAARGRSAKFRLDLRKLTPAQAADIRERFKRRGRRDPINGPLALSREFGVDTNVIYRIAGGRTYFA